ncbi:MAG: ankyrin repeat domain-containing protein [Epsilonproteobacteria bacterium]|nr:ankyrin repeat domain-containing protein [Campylobacterota bacterium]
MKYMVSCSLIFVFFVSVAHGAEGGGQGQADAPRKRSASLRDLVLKKSHSGGSLGDTEQEQYERLSTESPTDVDFKPGDVGDTALIMSVKKGSRSLSATNLLLTHNANPNVVDNQKMSVLHHALRNKDRQHFNLLVTKMSLGSLNGLDSSGLAPLHYAILWGDLDVVAKLLEKGVNKMLLTEAGQTPLQLVQSAGHDTKTSVILAEMLKPEN